jgi:hypothetical protein
MLVCSNKGGAVLRGAMMMTIKLSMSKKGSEIPLTQVFLGVQKQIVVSRFDLYLLKTLR